MTFASNFHGGGGCAEDTHTHIQGGNDKTKCGKSCVLCLVAQLCPTPCDPMDYSLPGSSVHGILQARIPEWVAMLFSRGIFLPQGLNLSSALQADSLLTEAKC